MGIYLNPNNQGFQEALNSKIYVDKTGLIEHLNEVVSTKDKFICVSRPRRFGKSMAVDMLTAYYSRGCNSKEMFSKLKIAGSNSFEKHLNKYNVIHLNISLYSSVKSIEDKIKEIIFDIIGDFAYEFTDLGINSSTAPTVLILIRSLNKIYARTRIPFIFIIDEWDCIFREDKRDTTSQEIYLNFLRALLKDQVYVALAYMTGILPIKKYGVHSALNMFKEVSILNPRGYEEYTGFTECEVKALCEQFKQPFDEMKRWYNCYNLNSIAVYNPCSVVNALTDGFDTYWNNTETYEALKVYIDLNLDGLKDKVMHLLAGEEIKINTSKFQNDMTTFSCADDVLTLLTHLGYLTYDSFLQKVRIPNSEVAIEFVNSIEDDRWGEVARLISCSEELLKATLNKNADKVAELIQQCHMENTSILKYNDENSLSCVISLAYYSARREYEIWRELPTGNGFADMVFVPRRNTTNPILVVELKKDQSSGIAIKQIRERNYISKLKSYSIEILLVGINYDSKNKKHSCIIETMNQKPQSTSFFS